jgi:hypothetical protein
MKDDVRARQNPGSRFSARAVEAWLRRGAASAHPFGRSRPRPRHAPFHRAAPTIVLAVIARLSPELVERAAPRVSCSFEEPRPRCCAAKRGSLVASNAGVAPIRAEERLVSCSCSEPIAARREIDRNAAWDVLSRIKRDAPTRTRAARAPTRTMPYSALHERRTRRRGRAADHELAPGASRRSHRRQPRARRVRRGPRGGRGRVRRRAAACSRSRPTSGRRSRSAAPSSRTTLRDTAIRKSKGVSDARIEALRAYVEAPERGYAGTRAAAALAALIAAR